MPSTSPSLPSLPTVSSSRAEPPTSPPNTPLDAAPAAALTPPDVSSEAPLEGRAPAAIPAWPSSSLPMRFPTNPPRPRARRRRTARALALQIGLLAGLVAVLAVGAFGVNGAFVDRLGGRDGSKPGGASSSAAAVIYPPRWSQAAQKDLTRLANQWIARMSLDDELGQLFLADFIGSDYPANDAGMVERYHAGGIILYSRSLLSAEQARAMIAAAQAHSPIPLLVTVDQEGGGVDRLRGIYGPHPSARTMAASRSTASVQQQGALVGDQMRALGLNLDFAPDVDVQLVAGPDLGSRNFGTDPMTVTTYAGAFLAGLQSAGPVGCLKHFPGLGAATTDAHQDLPLINRTRAQIEAVELAPYRALIATGQVQCIMTTDLLMPALDPNLPAELSPTIINGVLRHDMGYDGVVITDALYMDGIAQNYSMPEAGVLSILAGNDILEGPWTPEQMGAMVRALKSALANGRLTKDRIDQSVRRVLALKMRMGLMAAVPPSKRPSAPITSQPPTANPQSLPVGSGHDPRKRREHR